VNEAIKENALRHEEKRVRAWQLEKFDRNHDGRLDDDERRAMAKDPQFAQEEQKLMTQQTGADMEQVVKRYDRDGDARLDLEELRPLRQAITLYLRAKESGIVPQRKPVFDRLVSERTPSAEEVLKRYDTDHDQKLSAAELSALAAALRKN
jgi:Ca2+-binding EF-hand superfamily protein